MEWFAVNSLKGINSKNFLKLDCSKMRKTFDCRLRRNGAYGRQEDIREVMERQVKEHLEG